MLLHRNICPVALVLVTLAVAGVHSHADPWTRHTIDNTSRGADGVRLADINGDSRMDITTGWEEGGVVRIYLAPDSQFVRKPWSVIEVGQVDSPEDAVFADVDVDGYLDVISCCEGKTKTVFVHWNPAGSSDGAWKTDAFPQLEGRLPWMYCQPMIDDQQRVSELVIGSKGGSGEIGILMPPEHGNYRDLTQWIWRKLGPAGWIMSIQPEDIDNDGRMDIIYSDRKQSTRGIHWFRRPAEASQSWEHLTLGGHDREVMFLHIADLDGDGKRDVVSAARHQAMLVLQRADAAGYKWVPFDIPYPPNTGTGKAVAVGDINGDKVPDLVCSCGNARGVSGVYWLSRATNHVDGRWIYHEISGADEGTKFDRLELVDVDRDGDPDVLTCEERENLGVIWYENPHGR